MFFHSRRLAEALILLACAVLPSIAFSAEPAGGTTKAEEPAAGGSRVEESTPGAPAPRGTASTIGAPPGPPPPAAVPEPRRLRFALVLPLDSKSFGRAAAAVRGGFLAAAAAERDQDSVAVVSYGDSGIEGAIELARFADPEWIVGPLTRDDVAALAKWPEPLPPVLALNAPDDPSALPAQVVTFALSAEREARQAAQRMSSDGIRQAAVVSGPGPLQRRLASTFEAEWTRAGGVVSGRQRVDAGTQARKVREELRSVGAEAVFMALDADEAQRLRPGLGPMRIYATSQVYDGQDSTLLRDLDGVRFYGMPWNVRRDEDTPGSFARPNLGSIALESLYAFGIDAYRLAAALRTARDPGKVSLEGVTGRIAMGGPRQFVRNGVLTEIRDGRLVVLEGE